MTFTIGNDIVLALMTLLWFVLNQESRGVTCYAHLQDCFDRFCPKEHCKDYRRAWNKIEKIKLVQDINYADDLTVLVEKVSIMNHSFLLGSENYGCKNKFENNY